MRYAKSCRLIVSSAALLAAIGANTFAEAKVSAANPPVSFAQTQSDIKPDPGARFGQLANGMTYVIYKNKTPPGEASVWMRFGAGSLMEQDYQRGLAHFLEHMAFNGSKNVPQGDMVKILERDGLKFGADTNAFTSFDETVYQLNLPKADRQSVNDALFLMHEIAADLNLETGAIDRQRGVILGEERARASADSRAQESLLKEAFPDQKYSARLAIGLTEVIKTAKPQALRDFYDDFYRPEYATLIVVGDIDPDVIEANIKAKFSGWAGRTQTKNALTDYGGYKNKGEKIHLYSETGLAKSTNLMWIKPFDHMVETNDSDFKDHLEALSSSILNERLQRLSKAPESGFLSASFGRSRIQHAAEIYELEITAKPHQERLAFDQSVAAMRQFLKYGADQAELDRALTRSKTILEFEASSAKTRETRGVTAGILGTVGSGAVFTSPEQNLQQWMRFEPKMTLGALNAYVTATDLGDGPLISRTGEDLSDFDRDAIDVAFKAAMAAPVPPPTPYVAKTWPYTQFGPPGRVASRTVLKDVGAVRVAFENGVVLNIKHTGFKHNEIAVAVNFVGGFSQLSPDKGVVLKAANSLGLVEGGLGKLEDRDINDALLGHIYGISFGIGEQDLTLSGATTRADLPTEMQLLTAFATDPGFRPEALDRLKERLPNFYASLRATPNGVFSFKSPGFLHNGDQRYSFPSQATLTAVTNDQVKSLVLGLLNTSPIEITIVGDVDEADAVKQVAATFGALPHRPPIGPRQVVASVTFPAKDLHQVYTHEGREDQNLSYLAWPTTDIYTDTKQARGLQILAELMTLRELEEIRERQGATYGVSTRSSQSEIYRGYGSLSTSATVRPEIDQTFYDSVAKIVADLKAAPVTSDEMLRAKKPQLEAIKNENNDNDYWLSVLQGSVQQPRQIPFNLDNGEVTKSITPKYVQELAQKYLDMKKAVRIQVKAQAAP